MARKSRLHYDPGTGAPTTTWEGGWDILINATVPFSVRVSSDPLNADSDGDGLADQAERQLAQDAESANRRQSEPALPPGCAQQPTTGRPRPHERFGRHSCAAGQ